MSTTYIDAEKIFSISRPDTRLLYHYVIRALMTVPAAPFVLAYLMARFHTMRYRFDEEGISMKWGALFHRETYLTYARIQDIHLASGIIERYLGLARIQIQTASGKAGAEMTIEGIREFEQVRDFIYSRMRGLKDRPSRPTPTPELQSGSPNPELANALLEVTEALRDVRSALEKLNTGDIETHG